MNKREDSSGVAQHKQANSPHRRAWPTFHLGPRMAPSELPLASGEGGGGRETNYKGKKKSDGYWAGGGD